MGLIACPECFNAISDKAESCIHCGLPLNAEFKDEEGIGYYRICPRCGEIRYNVKTHCGVDTISTHYKIDFIYKFIEKDYPLSSKEWHRQMRERYVINSPYFDKDLYEETLRREADNEIKSLRDANKPKCPTCGSTNTEKISMGSKAVGGFFFGLFSSDVRNTMKCNNCGYKW